jgi:hypothetical protein
LCGCVSPKSTHPNPRQIFEGSLEVKLPTTWGDGKAEVGTVTKTKKRREEERRLEQRKGEKKEDASARKGIKVVIHLCNSNDVWLWRVEK